MKTKKRPTLLTALCLMTFFGSGINVIYQIGNAYTIMAWRSVNFENDFATSSLDVAYAPILLNIIWTFFCVVGAFQMWNLKKIGIFIYSIGEIVPALSNALTEGIKNTSFSNQVFSVGLYLVPALFVIMYFCNYKYLFKEDQVLEFN